jgi:hypothetical protein
MTLRNAFSKPARKVLLRVMPITMVAGTIIGGTGAGFASYNDNVAKSGQIPTGYSEAVNTIGEMPAVSRVSTSAFDIANMVFQSSNEAFVMGNKPEDFAHALQNNIGENELHTSLETYALNMPQDVANALQTLDGAADAAEEMPAIATALSNAWSESHYDVTHEEEIVEEVVEEVETCSYDADGEEYCTTSYETTYEITYETVYDYTIHTYNYDREQGELAERLLNEFMARHPDVNIDEVLKLAVNTSPENEKVMAESRSRALGGKEPTDQDYLALANIWATGSKITQHAPALTDRFNTMKDLAAQWDQDEDTADSTFYITFNHWDSGPEEYQTAKQSIPAAQALSEIAHKIVDGIKFSGQTVPQLNDKIKQYIDVVLDNRAGDAGQLRAEIMDMARALYNNNIEKGVDVNPFKVTDIILLTMLGIVLGGGIGAGAGFGIEQLGRKLKDLKNTKNIDLDDVPSQPVSKTKPKTGGFRGPGDTL